MTLGGNFWTLFTPGIWKVLHAVFYRGSPRRSNGMGSAPDDPAGALRAKGLRSPREGGVIAPPMGICLIGGAGVPEAWRNTFEAVLREEGLFVWDGHGATEAECAIVARPQPGALGTLRGLRLVSSVGMGVDHILADPDLPAGVPVVRVVTDEMVAQVAEYVLLAVLRVERDSDRFDRLQREGRWERRLDARPGGRRRVGLLGLGSIGASAARHLVALGFPVRG